MSVSWLAEKGPGGLAISSRHTASWSRSPVRTRMALSTVVTHSLPSPIVPVRGACHDVDELVELLWPDNRGNELHEPRFAASRVRPEEA